MDDATFDQVRKDVLQGVGYKRPPVGTRFRKGQSGNPKGRPKTQVPAGTSSTDELVLREAERMVTIREGDQTKEITIIEAIIRSQSKSAAGGNAYAQRHAIDRYERAVRAKRAEMAAFIAKTEAYIERCRSEIAEAEASGDAPLRLLPHPEDIIIDRVNDRVRFLGPVDEQGAAEVEETCRVRDALIMQDALDRRLADETRRRNPRYQPGLSLLFAQLLDMRLPVRLRLSNGEMLRRMARNEGTPKRELLKDLRQAWHDLGIRNRHGQVFPTLHFAEDLTEQLDQINQSDGLSPTTVAR